MMTEVMTVKNASELCFGDWIAYRDPQTDEFLYTVMVLEVLDAQHVEVIEDQHSLFEYSR